MTPAGCDDLEDSDSNNEAPHSRLWVELDPQEHVYATTLG